MSTTPALEIRNLTRRYGTVAALDDLSLTLEPGRIVALFGENGSGKTTLLKVISGLLAEYTGEVLVHGHRPGPESKAMVSFLPDQSFLPDTISAATAVEMFSDFFADFDAARATTLIADLGVDATRKLKTLSKGQREKVQLALAMSRRARIYLLDEPISGVDPAAREVILNTILAQYDPDALVVISTHLIADIEAVADAAVFLRGGRVLMAGDADDLRASHGQSLDQLFRTAYQTTRS
ncbi:MAG: ABC transporter ATP-binding protein [Propioniciclava sp.]|uniref:ABC transporter ATP-binding protein n=1 Tax=Propioniciclava sp. TaxID=2038686 RepID=UPI0039E6CC7F